jgi:hypothetical protein
MDIKKFCSNYSTPQLQEQLEECKNQRDDIINRFADPDHINNMLQTMINKEAHLLDKEQIHVMLVFLVNSLNIEVTEKELFRREMEDE